MNTQWTARVRLCALAVAGIAIAGISVGASVRADNPTDNRPVMALNGWNGQMGPGIGSAKTPFGIAEIGNSIGGTSGNTMYFHTGNGQAVQQTSSAPMGPGPWSVKSPYNGLYSTPVSNGDSF